MAYEVSKLLYHCKFQLFYFPLIFSITNIQ